MSAMPDRPLSPPPDLVDAARARLHRHLDARFAAPGSLDATLPGDDGPPVSGPPTPRPGLAPSPDTPVSASVETLAAGAAPAASRTFAGLAGATKIGRYVFLEPLGEGGTGVVVAAYDPQLDRKVAIKLIHALRWEDGERRLRMEREAQAMAKLSHPNVVTVYEVGEYEAQLFLAMEFVKGQDLRGWLRARGPAADWRTVLDVFIQAGQGLAAAHRAGLVHRDFKPDNVFVGEDGRVRVGDFGLARQEIAADAETVAARTRAQAPADALALARQLTATGAMMGTPAYMAPEQFAGAPTDARTDQFSFCVALWEALYGQRPFAAQNLGELIFNVTTGKRQPPPQGRGVPGWLRRLLERGLSAEPADRFPGMETLLAALRADPTRRRRLLAGAVGVALALAGGAGVQRYVEVQQVAACEAAGASIAEVWNDEVRQQLQDGLLATGVPYAATTAQRVVPYISAQAEAWSEARTEACLNTQVRKTWDEDTLDRAVWCLDERRMELAAMVTEFSQASATSMQNAITAAAKLSQVEPCLDRVRLTRLPAPPQDREGARAVQALLVQAGAKEAAGTYDEGLAAAEDALTRAEELAWPPLVAAARLRRGSLLERSGKYRDAEAALKDAYFQAAEVGAWEVGASAATDLVKTMDLQVRHDEARLWWRHAEVALTHLGADAHSPLRGASLKNLAEVCHGMGDYREARALHERALAIREQALGPEHPDVADSLMGLALVLHNTGSSAEARGLYERARVIHERALGPDHPTVADSLSGLAFVLDTPEGSEEARVLYEQALVLREKTLGPDHPYVAGSLHNVALVLAKMGRHEEARALYERSRAISEKALGPDHPDIALSLNNLALVHANMGEYEEAKALYQRALAIEEKALGPDHPDVAVVLSNLAMIYHKMGEYEAAKAQNKRMLAIEEKALGSEHPHVALSLNNIAVVHAAMGEYEEAKTLYQRALAIQEKALGPEHPQVAFSLNNLASLHADTGGYEEAKILAERALAIQEKALGPDDPKLASSLTLLADVALGQRRVADAVMLAERAVHLRETHDAAARDLAESRFVLARALWAAPRGRDRERARALAHRALDVFRGTKGTDKQLAAVKAFLKRHADRD